MWSEEEADLYSREHMTPEQRAALGDTEQYLKRRGRPPGSKDARPRKRRSGHDNRVVLISDPDSLENATGFKLSRRPFNSTHFRMAPLLSWKTLRVLKSRKMPMIRSRVPPLPLLWKKSFRSFMDHAIALLRHLRQTHRVNIRAAFKVIRSRNRLLEEMATGAATTKTMGMARCRAHLQRKTRSRHPSMPNPVARLRQVCLF